ncbi:Flp family type IVb pilin [Nitrosomonas sp. Nm132]|uniref:Flp family type IVb pilin n=1 Tax=Nitrosomonas sp. Nm132 TaxID=1881053 RepID=UPI00088A9868|nr:Flp family type IVb pilin [Nitrosomonas sp. Nm132]SDH42268.1 pilus assembly protein Flp/PilA [Nitrosomonas sp. Nm132]
MNKLIQSAKQFINDEQGMGAVEYALIVAIMAAGIVITWPSLSSALDSAFTAVKNNLATPPAP